MRITETSNIIHEFLGSNYRFRVSPYIEPSKDGGSKPVEVHNKRVDITKAVRVSVLKRDNYRCQWCGATSFTAELVIDHIVPVARGGKNNIENLRVLCKDCNEGKSSKLDEDI
ncbi:MAG TPA: hypothetical protein DCZ10_15745 [Pelotomaculum sp.]|nr:hypothetical protein [Pelotomaculum sp.]